MNRYFSEHNINDNNNCCDECKIAKMKIIYIIPSKATSVLEVIYSDIIGSINKSYIGKSFILILIDEFSRKSWLFLLKKKKKKKKKTSKL